MANCKEYQELTPFEKKEYIGSLIHAVQSDPNLFKEGQRIINKAIARGLFEGVIINAAPESFSNQLNTVK